MNRQMLARMIIGLTLFLLLLACDLLPSTFSQNVIATSVSGTMTAVAERTATTTLIAELSKLTVTPTPTGTPKPALTQTTAPTVTPALPTRTPTPTLTLTVGRVEGKIPGASGLKVTLCDKMYIGAPIFNDVSHCEGAKYEQSTTIDATGYFLFSAVPTGVYFILFDIPTAILRAVTPVPLCQEGEYSGTFSIPDGSRLSCLSKTWAQTVVVRAGRTTEYPMVGRMIYMASLLQPIVAGAVNADGNAEVVIANDYPSSNLSVRLDGSRSQSVEIPYCKTCKYYIDVGPSSCQTTDRPQTTVRVPSGVHEVTVSADETISTTVQWTLQGDKRYQTCFFVVVQ